MKTAISLPDQLFRDAEKVARQLKKSRSYVYRQALAEYVVRHKPKNLTAAFNRVVDALATEAEDPHAFVQRASRRVLRGTEW